METKKRARLAKRWRAVSAVALLLPLSVLAQDPGNIFYGARAADGSWSSFYDIQPEAGRPALFTDVSISSGASEPQLVGKTADGRLWHTIHVPGRWRYFFDQPIYFPPHWLPYDDVQAQAGTEPGDIFQASISANFSTGELHLVVLADDNRAEWAEHALWHSIRRADGTWSQFSEFARSVYPLFSRVSISVDSATGDLHVVSATSEDGKLQHRIRRADGTWRYVALIAGPGPAFSNLGVSANSTTHELHVAGTTSDGNLWHAIRRPDGTGTVLANIPGSAGPRYLSVATAVDPSSSELRLLTYDQGAFLYYTVRRPDGNWSQFQLMPPYGHPVGCETAALSSALIGTTLHVAAIGGDPCIF